MKSIRKAFVKFASSVAKDYAPEFAVKILLGYICKYTFQDLIRFADENRNLFREGWIKQSTWKRRRLRGFFSHIEKQVRPVMEKPALIRKWFGEEAKRLLEKEVKTASDDLEMDYIDYILKSPKIFSWVCMMASDAAKAIFNETEEDEGENKRPSMVAALEVEETPEEEEVKEEPLKEQSTPESPPAPSSPQEVYGIIVGEEEKP